MAKQERRKSVDRKKKARAWVLTAKGENREYAGNAGYADVPSRVYPYDSNVANSRQLNEGDLAFVSNGNRLVGVAVIERIRAQPGKKFMRRCPRCGRAVRKERVTKRPRYVCDRGHGFDEPDERRKDVTEFEAHYGRSFIPVPEGVSAAQLRSAALRGAQQNAMREIVLSRILERVAAISAAAGRLLRRFARSGASAPDTELGKRSYWVVSPNVRNHEPLINEWRQVSIRARAAFMGWDPDDYGHGAMGPRFAGHPPGGIQAGDVILIARRKKKAPEIVGFGVVSGGVVRRLKGIRTPEPFRSLRRLRPFKAWSRPPAGVPLMKVLGHTRALAQLHPDQNSSHRRVCQWLALELATAGRNRSTGRAGNSRGGSDGGHEAIKFSSSANAQLDYEVRTREQVIRAKAVESRLVVEYRSWLKQQNRTLPPAQIGTFRCDGFEEERLNLIEAKSSCTLEHIRMAAGQLLHYAFLLHPKYGAVHMAILLPHEPSENIVKWLPGNQISLIWREQGCFVDNADGQFT